MCARGGRGAAVRGARRPLRSASPLPPSAIPLPATTPHPAARCGAAFGTFGLLGRAQYLDKFRTFRRHHARSAFSRLTQFVSAVAVRRIVYFCKAGVLREWGLLGATGRRVA
jgi:hypothetical protein